VGSPTIYAYNLIGNLKLTRPRANFCSAMYTKPPHLGQPSPSGALAIDRVSKTAQEPVLEMVLKNDQGFFHRSKTQFDWL